MSRITQAMLSMTGRVTMLGISRWAGKGGSYRTVQRFFNTLISWPQVFSKFFEKHLYEAEGDYFLVGDESVITKSGKETHGLDRFFFGTFEQDGQGHRHLFFGFGFCEGTALLSAASGAGCEK